MIVGYDDELALIEDVLALHGATTAHAETQARWLVEADLRGHPSHGIQRVPVLVGRMKNGLIDPTSDPTLTWLSECVLAADGRRGFGPCVGCVVGDELVRQATTMGIAAGAIHNSNHLGLLAPYLERIASESCVGIVVCTTEALVHPWNGSKALIGTNPIGIGLPVDPSPVIVDMATGAVSMGKLLSYARRGEPLELGWAVDSDGRPTTNPGCAVKGAITPFGGPKGYALGLAIELIVAILTDTALGSNVRGTLDTEYPCTKGDLFIVLAPSLFTGEHTANRVAEYLAELRGSGQDRDHPVRVPGDRARAEREHSLQQGIEIDDTVWAEVSQLRREWRVPR